MNEYKRTTSSHNMKILFPIIISLLSLVLLTTTTFSNQDEITVQTYVDHEITVLANGASKILGSSNVAVANTVPADDKLAFDTNALTSKKGDYWTFTYLTAQIVNISLIKVQLPANAVINYVYSPATTFIEGADTILLTFTDSNKPINITIQYSFRDARSANATAIFSTKIQQYGAIAIGSALFIIIFGLSVVIIRHKRKNPVLAKVQSTISGIDVNKLNTLKLALNETQIKIIDALLEREGRATQNSIAHHTQIPKASLSRNVDLLVQKQIIIKHASGYTNQLIFHESLHFKKNT